MFISKTRFINWTRCPMYFPMELKHNPSGMNDINVERERREEMLSELRDGVSSTEGTSDEEEVFVAETNDELAALLPYYHRVEKEALRVARKYFKGEFIADFEDVRKQKLFEYELHNHTYRCYVDIYNDSGEEINIIEVKATTTSKFFPKLDRRGKWDGLFYSDRNRGGNKYPLFVSNGNIWHLIGADGPFTTDFARENFKQKRAQLLERYSDVGKYPYDIAFQRFVIEHALRKAGVERPINFYLAVLNNKYVYDGTVDDTGACVYNEKEGQEIITFFDMNDISAEYQQKIKEDIARLESYINTLHDVDKRVDVGKYCEWGKKTECLYWRHCFQKLRTVPDSNKANNYLYSYQVFQRYGVLDKYWLINHDKYSLKDIDTDWLSDNQKIQRDCYDSGKEHVDREKMKFWLDEIKPPIYHLDFETFPCPLPRFRGENPYRQSVFEFSLHIERAPGVCDLEKDNYIFLNDECFDDEREALAKAIVDHFEFNKDGTLHGTMLAQNTSFERGRLEELAELFPEYKDRLLAIRDKSMDLIDLLKTEKTFYNKKFDEARAKLINYYHKDLSGSYSIKKTLPVLVPDLSYDGMDVGNGVQAYVAYINYDSKEPTVFGENKKAMYTKDERRDALRRYCQQDTWAMVEILRAVRKKLETPY